MKNNRTAFAARNMAFGLVNRIVMTFTPFLMLAVIQTQLGSEYLGLNNLFSSLLQMLCLAEMGLGSAMVYALYKPVALDNRQQIQSLLRLYQRIYRIVSCAILLMGCICIPFLPKLINGTVPQDTNLYALYAVYLANTVLSYGLFAYKKSLLQAHQRMDIISKISSVVHIGLYVLQFVSLIIFRSYYLYAIMLPVSTIVDNLLVNHVVQKKYPDIKACGEVTPEIKQDMFSRVRALAGHKIGAIVISSFDSIVISAVLGLKAVALYSNYYYIVKALTGIINIGYSSILPGVGNSVVVDSKEKIYQLYKKVSFMLMWFVGWASVCLVCLYDPFVTLWMGREFVLPTHTMILFVVYFYVWQIRVAGLIFKDAAGLWKEDFWKPYIGLFANLVVNIVLAILFGIDGVVLTTIFVMTLIYYPWETWVLYRKLFERNIKEEMLRQLKNIIVTIAAAMGTYFVCCCIPTLNTFWTLVIRGIACLFLPNILMYCAYHNAEEYQYLLSFGMKFLSKVKR